MTDIDGYLYSGQNRIGITTNPIYVTYSSTVPSEFTKQNAPDQNILVREVIKEVIKEVPVVETVVKEIPVYNIKGDSIFFKAWYYIGCKVGWIHGC